MLSKRQYILEAKVGKLNLQCIKAWFIWSANFNNNDAFAYRYLSIQAYYEVSCILNLTLWQTQLIVGVCAFMYQSTAILQENFTHETERVR